MDKHLASQIKRLSDLHSPGWPGFLFGSGMVHRKRDILTITVVITLAAISFAVGYLLNDAIQVRFGSSNLSSDNEEFSLFWEAWGKVESSFIGTIPSDKQITYGAVRGAIEVLDDPYTIFIEPSVRDRERESLSGWL